MMEHYQETDTTYRVRVERGFQVLKRQHFNQPTGHAPQDFKVAVRPLAETRRRVFIGFSKCCYEMQSFQSDDERRFAVLIDSPTETSVIRWVKPGRGQFIIEYRRGDRYEPDFVVETATEKLICEVKARKDLDDPDVLAKARAARTWVHYANDHARQTGGKPWRYVLIPHDAVLENATLAGLAARFSQSEIVGDAKSG
jgi:type III restriction enzyme